MEGIKNLIRDGEGKGMLESKLFQLLSDVPLEDACWDVLVKFIDFLSVYEKQVKAGNIKERIMVAGIYEATECVDKVDWDRMKEMIKRIKEQAALESPGNE